MNKFEKVFDSNLPHRAVILYMYLEFRANKEGFCWPTMRRISEDLHLSRSTVIRAVRDLEAARLITTQHRIRDDGAWSSLLYKLNK